MRPIFAWVLLAIVGHGGDAFAQPEPRLIGTTEVAPLVGLAFEFPLARDRLLLMPDGSIDALLVSGTSDTQAPRTVELARFGRDGALVGRSTIVIGRGESMNVAGPYRLASGDLAVASGIGVMPRVKGLLIRLAPDGRVNGRLPIVDPHYVSANDRNDSSFEFNFVAGAPDGTAVVAGAYGPGPYSWWWARFAANGARIAERGASLWGIPNRVDAGRFEPDGSLRAVVGEINRAISSADLWLHGYDARGTQTLHHKLVDHTEAYRAAFRGEEIVVADFSSNDKLSFFDAGGGLKHSVSLRGLIPWKIAADADGLLMLADHRDDRNQGFKRRVLRCDREGAVLWKSERDDLIDAVRAPDGTAWVLAQSGADKAVLRHYAGP